MSGIRGSRPQLVILDEAGSLPPEVVIDETVRLSELPRPGSDCWEEYRQLWLDVTEAADGLMPVNRNFSGRKQIVDKLWLAGYRTSQTI